LNRLWVSRDYKEGAKSDKTLFRILSFRIPMLKEKKNFLKVVGFIGREINVLSDSTSFYNIEIDSKQKLATNQISEITTFLKIKEKINELDFWCYKCSGRC